VIFIRGLFLAVAKNGNPHIISVAQAMRSEPVWPFRLEPAGDAMRKMEKEGKFV
jgi:hypothetical protein